MENNYQKFEQNIANEITIEAKDQMPDAYRKTLIRQIGQHGHSEIVGMLPEGNWITRAPTLKRKAVLLAKVQDEAGHGLYLYSAAETLGADRDDMMEKLINGKMKYSSIFNYPTLTWADVAAIGWLVDGAAIITQTNMLGASYGPYARALQRICAEEVFHAQHGESIIMALAEGTPEQRAMIQESLDEWWESLLMFFGPASKETTGTSKQDVTIAYKIRTKTNEELRQNFFTKYVPRIRSLGLVIPDPTLRFDEETGQWEYAQPDWTKFKTIIQGGGPRSKERLELRRTSYENNAWVRDALAETKA